MRLLVVLVLVVAVGVTFATDDGSTRGTATVVSGTHRVTLAVEIARTRAERRRGLSGRSSVPTRTGMVFLYPKGSRASFWMKDTLVPLAAAFYDGRGRILRIVRMEPCTAEPCPLYDPRVRYRGVLEVGADAFARWGIGPGAIVRVQTDGSWP